MFDFLHQAGMRHPSGALLDALQADGQQSGTDLAALGVVESRGRYSGRKVTYLRVFDPKQAAGRVADPAKGHTYQGLNAHLDLILRSGFTEKDGTVVLNGRPTALDAVVPRRELADRAAHSGFERFIFPMTGASRLAP